ncbi:serine arginine-rich splicing factor RS2Z33-like isoform X1 [Paramuricea clavata]|uniref:Serine arginine-rich splicing factor RS2Z33-like isoform X1 n=2 Tax=Paramuricea clavata TaxID=317549 RepID=A0A7D9K1C3_PARCT|nr:serine arginine-rich splicing factor RS2Z33-like isoform X1 [Paramuricea clavata]
MEIAVTEEPPAVPTKESENDKNNTKEDNDRDNNTNEDNNRDTAGPIRRKKGYCYKCGLRGHHAKDCTSRVVCWTCGERGHIQTKCPRKEKKNGRGVVFHCTSCTFKVNN